MTDICKHCAQPIRRYSQTVRNQEKWAHLRTGWLNCGERGNWAEPTPKEAS